VIVQGIIRLLIRVKPIVGGFHSCGDVSNRVARLVRAKARGAALVRGGEVDAGYEEARRLELVEMAASGDEVLGSMVDSLIRSERMRIRAAACNVEQIYAIVRYAEVNIPVVTSHVMRPWSQAATARRTAVPEVAAVLRIPDRLALALVRRHGC
jgi:hypothetical protein